MDFRVSLLVLMCFALIACGSRAYAAPPTDACSLLTPAQAGAVLGMTVGAGKSLGANQCFWSSTGNAFARQRVLLHLFGTVGTLTPAQQFDATKAPVSARGIVKTSVSGIGDDAVYVERSERDTGLTVKKGNTVFTVTVYGFPLDQIKAKEKTLALDVLKEL
jgi:hypothetical protein